MPTPNPVNPNAFYKIGFWILAFVLITSAAIHWLDGPGDADEVVLKRELHGGAWLYATRYIAPATDLDTLRFYIKKPLQGDDTEILQQLNENSGFMITDSALEDIAIRDTHNGINIELQGAVYRYFSKQYLTQGEKLTSYRITLTQRDNSVRQE
ncbi:hypothetical protein KDX30_27375 [Pseudomonas sp. CDFA 553]|uniref:hypothetical protein n=1 Tax=Pseudomonas quasicaspiana TaxID=2829821 RepID=UPI0022286435|nr:hypothetical protein [Pseudomonas quasicaspiana]